MQIDIETPDTNALVASAMTFVTEAEQFAVTDADTCQFAADQRNALKKRAKELHEQRLKITRKIDDSKEEVMALFRDPIETLTRAADAYDTKVIGYMDALKREREEAQRKADEIARKERDRLESEARKAEAAAKEKAAEIGRQAALARAQGDAEQATKLDAKAEATLDKAASRVEGLVQRIQTVVAPVVTAAPAPKIKGLRLTQRWYARVVNPGLIPREYLVVNQEALDKVAQATKNAITIPGVEFYSETVSASSKR